MELPDVFIKKTPEDPYSCIGKSQKIIKNLIDKDKKLIKAKLNSPSRDVSYIKDKIISNKKVLPLNLPTSISHLKSLMQTSNSKGIQISISPYGENHLTCAHKECIDRVAANNSNRKLQSAASSRKLMSLNSSPVIEKFPSIEREFLGSPTGTQEVESLYEWFNLMKNKCEDHESQEVVYTMCAREILRQVTLQSSLRGKILEEIITLQPAIFSKKYEKSNQELIKLKQDQEKQISYIQKKFLNEMENKDRIILDLENALEKKNILCNTLQEAIDGYKHSLNYIQKKYSEAEETWKDKIFFYTEELKKNKKTNIAQDKLLIKNTDKVNEKDYDLYKFVVQGLSSVTENIESNEDIERDLNTQQGLIKPENIINPREKPESFIRDPVTEDYKVLENQNNPYTEEVKIDDIDLLKDISHEDIQKEVKTNTEILKDSFNDDMQEFDTVTDNSSPLEVPGTIIIPKNEDKAIYSPEQIFEAPSYDEESRDVNSKSKKSYQSLLESLNKEVQTEDLLFQIYLEKLQKSEVILSKASHDEIEEVLSSISALNNKINRKKNLKPRKPYSKTPSADKIKPKEVILKLLSSTPDTSSRVMSPVPSKNVSESITDLLSSINYLGNAINQRQQKISDLDAQIDLKTKVLEILHKKKNFKNLNVKDNSFFKDRRVSEQIIQDRKLSELIIQDRRLSEQIIQDRRLSEQIIQELPGGILKDKIKKKFTQIKNFDFDEGYELGYEDGKIQGFLKAIQKLKQSEELTDSDFYSTESKTELKNKYGKLKSFTKFLEFNFHTPTKFKAKKINPGPFILKKFLSRPLDQIKAQSTLTRKKINKILSAIYSEASIESKKGLIEATYDEFYARYGLKSTCDKKFLQFIASVISNSDYRRCWMYIRLLGYGEIISSYSYSKYSFVLYLSCLQYINSSRLGIYFCTDYEDKIMVPTIRVTDCLKEKLDCLGDKSVLLNSIQKVEQVSVPDPKKINPGGLVELEMCLEIALDYYEKYSNSIKQGVYLCLKSMRQHKKNSLLNTDFQIILRAFAKTIKEPNKDILLEELYLYCIKNNIVHEQDVIKFTPETNKNLLIFEIKNLKDKIFTIIDALKDYQERSQSYEPGVWDSRMTILEGYTETNLFLASLGLKLYQVELSRLEELL